MQNNKFSTISFYHKWVTLINGCGYYQRCVGKFITVTSVGDLRFENLQNFIACVLHR